MLVVLSPSEEVLFVSFLICYEQFLESKDYLLQGLGASILIRDNKTFVVKSKSGLEIPVSL